MLIRTKRRLLRGVLVLGVVFFGSSSDAFSQPPEAATATRGISLRLAEDLTAEGDARIAAIERRRAELLDGTGAAAGCALPASSAKTSQSWPLGAFPVRIVVGFYRVFVGPILGHRCILEPSCSRYSLQAARERGWLGLPMTGDRLIREPSVVAARERVVINSQGEIRIADPPSDHIGGRRMPSGVKAEEGNHAHR